MPLPRALTRRAQSPGAKVQEEMPKSDLDWVIFGPQGRLMQNICLKA